MTILAVRRLELIVRHSARDHGRPVVLVCGLRGDAGVSTVCQLLGAESADAVVVDADDARRPAPASLTQTSPLTIIDVGAVLSGGGPQLHGSWMGFIAGAVVVVCAERDVTADVDAAADFLKALELPVLGVVWSQRAAPPVTATVTAWRMQVKRIWTGVMAAVGLKREPASGTSGGV